MSKHNTECINMATKDKNVKMEAVDDDDDSERMMIERTYLRMAQQNIQRTMVRLMAWRRHQNP